MTTRRRPDVVIEDPGRATLHRLLDEICDRKPEVQTQILGMLRQTIDVLDHPDARVGMRVLTAARSVLEALGEHRASRG